MRRRQTVRKCDLTGLAIYDGFAEAVRAGEWLMENWTLNQMPPPRVGEAIWVSASRARTPFVTGYNPGQSRLDYIVMLIEKYWGGSGAPFAVRSGVIRGLADGDYCVEMWFGSANETANDLNRFLCRSIESARTLMQSMAFVPDEDGFTSDADIAWLTKLPKPTNSGEVALAEAAK